MPYTRRFPDDPPDPGATRRRQVLDYTTALRTMPAAQILADERAHRAAHNLDLAAAARAEINRRTRWPC